MFDFIFDLFSAWNQLGLILMGTVFFAIGALIIAYEMYYRIWGTKVRGRIVAVKAIGNRNSNSSSAVRDEGYHGEEEGKNLGKGGLIFLILFASIFSGIGGYMGWKYYDLKSTGIQTEGTIIRNDQEYDSDSGTMYRAIVEFFDASGHRWELGDSMSSGSPSFSKGTRVGIFYDRENPERFIIDSFWHTMLLPLIFFFAGFLIVAIGVFASRQGKKSYKGQENTDVSYGNEFFYPVFEFYTPGGERFEQVGQIATNSILGNLPGSDHTLYIFPKKPDKIKRPSVGLLLFGLVFLLPGLFLLNMAIDSFEPSIGMFFLVLGLFGFVGYKISLVANDIPFDEIKKGWDEMKAEGIQISTFDRNASNARVLDDQEIAVRVKSQAKYMYVYGYLFLIIALGLAGGAYYTGLDMIDRIHNGVYAEGKVVDMNQRRSTSDGSTTYTYHALVEYKDQTGQRFKFEDSMGSSHPIMKIGDGVKVLYIPNNAHDAIIDRGLMNWAMSVALGFGCLFLLWAGFGNIGWGRRYGGTKYQNRI